VTCAGEEYIVGPKESQRVWIMEWLAAVGRNKRGRYRDNDPVWKADSGYPRGGKFEVADQWE